jgi:hypothetical protein
MTGGQVVIVSTLTAVQLARRCAAPTPDASSASGIKEANEKTTLQNVMVKVGTAGSTWWTNDII